MKKSGFKRKNTFPETPSYKWKIRVRTKPKKEGKGLFDHLKTFSKVEEWHNIRIELKEKFLKAGIISCELSLEGCTKAYNFGWTWGFAHSLKRNKISKIPEIRYLEIREVVYSCGNCHNIIEKIGNKERFDGKLKMQDYVRNAILARKIPLTN